MSKIKTSSAKTKGRKLQQWVCQKISDLTGYAWGPDEMIASREGGQPGVDVRLIGDALADFPWSIECKRCENLSIPTWIEQARKNQLSGTDWLLVVKQNRQDEFVVLNAEVFFDILKLIPYKKKGR